MELLFDCWLVKKHFLQINIFLASSGKTKREILSFINKN